MTDVPDGGTPAETITAENIPQEWLDLLDKAAGKDHSRTGSVVACLIEILNLAAARATAAERERMSAEALVAVIDMIEDRYDGTICQRDYDVLSAAAPVIAARAAAEPRWHCTADPATVPCGRCIACRCDHVDAYQAGAAAQREADIKLARDYRVMVCLRRNDDGTVYYLQGKDFYPFADVLAAAPEEAK